MDHVDVMSNLKHQVATYSFAQKDPLVVYKNTAYEIFQKLIINIKSSVIKTLLKAEISQNINLKPVDGLNYQGGKLKEDFSVDKNENKENKKRINLDSFSLIKKKNNGGNEKI